jgi:signal transduction histidine kinase
MRPVDLWRHTSFRLALGVALFVLATLMLAGGIGYGLMQAQLAVRQDARVTEIYAAIEETGQLGDEAELIEALESRIKASPSRATAYRLLDAIGATLASNIGDAAIPDGWSTVPAARLTIAADHSYRLFTGKVGHYSLTVGLSNADQDVLQADLLASFGWAALAALLAALAVGTTLAVRVQARMTVTEATAARIAQGDLSARLPITGKGDDLDRVSQAVNAALERLASVVEATQQVSSDIAHDLRTPLNRLRINLLEAAQKLASGENPENDLSAALAQGETIDQTFTALLRIAQIEAGARREKFAPVDLAALVADVADVYANVAEDAGSSLAWETHGPMWVMGDRELLTQTFANLIENAIRHCPPGTAIALAVQAEGEHVTASISDTGPGIPVAERDKVLRRLYRLEKSRTTEGTGLGLALVKAVTDLHGAKLILTDAAPGLRVIMQFVRIHGVA